MTHSKKIMPAIPRALVVNDDTTQLNVLCGLLQKAGLVPVAFKSAESALAALGQDEPPALIVTDLYMPGVDGWRFCRLLRSPEYAQFSQTPILVVSATFSGDEPSLITSELGANGFMSMPVDGEQFVETVLALLRGEKPQDLLKVLIVEDSILVSKRLLKAFQAHGYQADEAPSFQEALAMIECTAYDAAVLDYHLPDGFGDGLLEALGEKSPDCICIMMTADSQPKLALTWLKMGAAAYLQKPFEPEYLISQYERARRERALLRIQDLLELRTKQLRQSEERFRYLVESSEDMILSVDRQGIFLTAGGNRLKEFGLRPEDVVHKSLYDLFPAPDAEYYHEKHLEVFTSKKSITYEQTFEYAGVVKTDLTTVYPIRTEGGEVESVGVICRDITEEKKLQAALQESQALYQDLIETQTDLVCRWLPDTTLTYVNQAYCVYFNRPREELLGSRFISWLPKETGNVIRSVVDSSSVGEVTNLIRDEKNIGPQGSMRWVQWVYHTIKDEHGKVIEFQSVGRDITERKLMEQALKLQHSLSVQLNTVKDTAEAMRMILAACLQFESIDSGGAYLLDRDSGCMQLIDHHGLSAGFIAACSTYPSDAPELLLARKGQIIYGDYKDIRLKEDNLHSAEGLQSLAVLPFLVGGELRAILNLASHSQSEFPAPVRVALETMLVQLSSALERIQAQEKHVNEATRRHILMEQSKDGIVILDQDGKVYESNKKFADMLGYPLESMRLLTAFDWEFLHPRERTIEMINSVDETGDHFESIHRRRDGSIYDVEISTNAAWFERQKLIFCVCRDITERKRLEQELSLKSLVLDQIQDHVTITDLQGNITYINEAEIKTMGIPRDQLIGNATTIYGEDAEKGATQREIVENTLRDGCWRCEIVNYSSDGKELFMDCRTQVIQGAEGKPIALCGIATDVTERKQAEQALRESEVKYRILFEQGPDGVVILEPETGRIIEFNDQACRQLGYTREEYANLRVADIEVVESAEDVRMHIQKILAAGHDEFETRHRTRLGEIRDIQVIVQVCKTGMHPIYHCIWRDVTDRKRAEQALHASEERYRLVDEASQDLIYSYDFQSRFTHANTSMCKIMGLNLEQIIGKTHEELGFPTDQCNEWAKLHQQVYDTNSTVISETKTPIQGGEPQYFEVVLNPIHDDTGAIIGIAGTTRDINARKRAEAKIIEQINELRRWHNATLGREDRILELKREVNKLLAEAGKPPHYASVAGVQDSQG